MKLSRKQKLKARDIARDAWIASGGDRDKAIEIAKQALRAECEIPADVDLPESEEDIKTVGGIITILTVTYLMLCIIKLLFDFWSDASVTEPSTVASDTEGVDWDE